MRKLGCLSTNPSGSLLQSVYQEALSPSTSDLPRVPGIQSVPGEKVNNKDKEDGPGIYRVHYSPCEKGTPKRQPIAISEINQITLSGTLIPRATLGLARALSICLPP